MATYWNDLRVLHDISKEIEESAIEHVNFNDICFYRNINNV